MGLSILLFHSLDDQPAPISFPPDLFRRGLGRLYEHGYRTLPLSDVVDRLQRGAPFPPRSFVITFDDGYRTVHDEAFPVLKEYGFSATVFLTVGETPASSTRLPSMAGCSMLDWDEIRRMHNAGISF